MTVIENIKFFMNSLDNLLYSMYNTQHRVYGGKYDTDIRIRIA